MTAVPASRVFLASWLEKKMEWRFVYERRYFILDGTRLSYRLEEHGAERKVGTIISFDPWRESSDSDTSKGYCFTVWLLEGGSWSLRAATREIYDSWFQALLSVLVLSNPASSLPSDKGDTHSSRGTSVASEGAAPPGGPPSAYVESEGLGLFRKAGDVGERDDNINRRRQMETVSGDSSRKTAGTTPTAEGMALIAAATNTHNSASVPEAVLLSSIVEKETAWRGHWKPRYMELREGRHLVIRSSATSKSERQHYVVESVDPSPLSSQARWLLFTTSTGDRFWVRYGSVEESQRWYSVCRRLLHVECSWHWLPLEENDAGRLLRLRQATSCDYSELHLHYHAATVVPSFQEETWCPSLYVFGGSDRWCQQMFNPHARAFLPHAEPAHTSNRLCTLELTGPHVMQLCQPAPYQESPHVLVRPLSRYGATLTCVPMKAPRSSAGGTEPCQTIGARVVLLGGVLSGGYQPPATELWSVWRSPSACAKGAGIEWDRHDLPPYELPMLAFHDAVFVPWGTEATSASAMHRLDGGFLLVTGGLDVEYRTRADCYAVVWNEAGRTAADSQLRLTSSMAEDNLEVRARLTSPAAFAFGRLPEPRAFHRMAVIEDGTVVLVGGRKVENTATPPILTLAPEVWRRASKGWHTIESDGAGATAPSAGDEDDADGSTADSMDAPSYWLPASFDSTTTTTRSTATQFIDALPSEMTDVAVAATGHGSRVVVMWQATQPCQQVKLCLLDFEAVETSTSRARNPDLPHISAGRQFPAGTRRVRCQDVLLYVGAVPNRVVGVTLHVFNDYLFVIGGCTVDKSKSQPHELCGPLRVLLE
ncbi:hypothetical protein JKF63_02945 [Porcisia hertigi]|uniref:PH domain-containing protein n=1 Tax=Porcisia hertigi TaxID=2761500 RepID=A0A836HT52_9TRYP|nr:hypothetical protein JKF63_02945 [Porcisia hertigi]